MNCTIHNEKEATGTCVFCGKFFCSDCLVDINGKNYCREHVANAIGENAAGNTQSQPNIVINNTSSNVNTNQNTNTVGNGMGNMVSPKSRLVSLLLCIFLGVIGAHRFYVGKAGTGLIWLFTGGLCGIGVLYDLIMIIIGSFRDANGMFVKNW